MRVSQDLTDEPLHQRIRERLTDGRLFQATGASIVRHGTGRPCNLCGRAIKKESIEREVQGGTETYALAHEDCFRIWREESRREQPPSAHA